MVTSGPKACFLMPLGDLKVSWVPGTFTRPGPEGCAEKSVILWFIIRNIGLVFVISGRELWKPLELCRWWEKSVLCYVNEMTLGPPPKNEDWLLEGLDGWHSQSHPPDVRGGEGAGGWLHRNGQSDPSCLCQKASLKPERTGLKSFWVGEHLGYGKSGGYSFHDKLIIH